MTGTIQSSILNIILIINIQIMQHRFHTVDLLLDWVDLDEDGYTQQVPFCFDCEDFVEDENEVEYFLDILR